MTARGGDIPQRDEAVIGALIHAGCAAEAADDGEPLDVVLRHAAAAIALAVAVIAEGER